MGALRNFWRSGLVGKIALIGAGGLGLFSTCCIALVAIGLMAPARSTGTAPVLSSATIAPVAAAATSEPIAVPEPTVAPTTAPSATAQPTEVLPTRTSLPSPTAEPPSATSEPTVVPTDVPTPEPTAKPKPTAKPAPPTAKPAPALAVVAPTAKPASAPIPAAADVGAAPCQPGQIKGNRNSKIYHAPGQRDYAKTYANVECFNTEAEAVAAGYRKAKR